MSVVVAALVVFGVKTYYEKKTTNDTGVLVEKENNASSEVGAKEASDEMLVPGYALGEIPAISIPEIPNLSVSENPDAKITLDMAKKISSVPGITISPVKVEDSNIVGGSYSMQIGKNGDGQYVDEKNNIKITIDRKGSIYTNNNITIENNVDGSGTYSDTDKDLLIKNDGKGKAIITLKGKTTEVEARPFERFEKFSKLKMVPPIPSIEANSLLITLDSGILFDVDKYDVRPEAEVALKNLAVVLKETDVKAFQIDGHTDSDANDEHNQVLSENRANAVKNFLAAQGLTAEISINGYGESRPIASNDTAEGKQKNRRVEIIIPTI